MGTFTNLSNYHEAGEETNTRNVEQFGEPAHALFTSTKVLSLHHDIEITDANENVVYRAHSKAVSIHDKTVVEDADGNEICSMERELMTIHPKRVITMADGKVFEVKGELMHLVKEVYNVPELGWTLQGNIMELNFELYDDQQQIIAAIGQKVLSIHDKASIEIYQPECEPYVVAIVVAIQHILAVKRTAASTSAASSSH